MPEYGHGTDEQGDAGRGTPAGRGCAPRPAPQGGICRGTAFPVRIPGFQTGWLKEKVWGEPAPADAGKDGMSGKRRAVGERAVRRGWDRLPGSLSRENKPVRGTRPRESPGRIPRENPVREQVRGINPSGRVRLCRREKGVPHGKNVPKRKTPARSGAAVQRRAARAASRSRCSSASCCRRRISGST